MRAWWIIVLLAVPAGHASSHACDAHMSSEDLPVCRQAAIEEALDAASADGWNGPAMLEASAALGRDPGPSVGTFSVADMDPSDPKRGVRALSAAARTGYDPTAYPDPEEGRRDLVAMLQERTTVDTDDDAVLSFLLLGMHGAGLEQEHLDPVADRLLELRSQGGWSCGLARPSTDCTGFSIQALDAARRLSPDVAEAAAAFVWSLQNSDGGFGLDAARPDSNGDSTAWALVVLQLTGHEAGMEAWRYLLGLQDGGFAWQPGRPASQSTTAAALVALAGGAAGPRYFDAQLRAPRSAAPGVPVTMAVEADNATWRVGAAVLAGTHVTWTPEASQAIRVEAWKDGEVFRASFTVHVDAPAPALAWWGLLASLLVVLRRRAPRV